MAIKLLGNVSMRLTLSKALVNLVSFVFGQLGICLWHSDSHIVLVDCELRSLTDFFQCVALAIKIRVRHSINDSGFTSQVMLEASAKA